MFGWGRASQRINEVCPVHTDTSRNHAIDEPAPPYATYWSLCLSFGALLATALPVSAQGFGWAHGSRGSSATWTWMSIRSRFYRASDARHGGRAGFELSLRPPYRRVRAGQPEGHRDADPGVVRDAVGEAAALRRTCSADRAGTNGPSNRSSATRLRARATRVWLARWRRRRGPGGRHIGIHGDYRYTFPRLQRRRW
jgi:hypothetical protein